MFLRVRNDESVMLAFVAGDARAFEELMRRHRAKVFTFLLRLVGERARAEDLAQETWLRVVKNAPCYEPKARFTTWLLTLARSVGFDHLRAARYRVTEDLSENLIGSESTPEHEASHRELRAVILHALARLPEEQREVFTLREWGGVSFADIATMLGISENTVKSRMRYALGALRVSLKNADFAIVHDAPLVDFDGKKSMTGGAP